MDNLQQMAALLVKGAKIHFDVQLEYDKRAINWIEDIYIDFLLEKYKDDEDFKIRVVELIGAFLGECIILNYGGSWQKENGHWAVSFGERGKTYPVGKVYKRFVNGPEDSISWYYELIPKIHTK